jgi:hypothetical protein
VHFAAWTAQNRPLQLAIELILEPIAAVIDSLEQLLHIFVAQPLGGLPRHRRDQTRSHHQRHNAQTGTTLPHKHPPACEFEDLFWCDPDGREIALWSRVEQTDIIR